MNQVEFILRLSENAQDTSDEIKERHAQERKAHIKNLLELEQMAALALKNIQNQLVSFGMEEVPHAPQAGSLAGGHQREHPRITPPREPTPLTQANSGNRAR